MRSTLRTRRASTAEAQVARTGIPALRESLERRASSAAKPIAYEELVDA
jgi:hypothetical protein